MKKFYLVIRVMTILLIAMILYSCGSQVTLTSWKNPNDQVQVTKVVICPMFDKLEYTKPFEQAMVTYFESKGLKAIGMLDFLNPTIKYAMPDVLKKVDSLGANTILVFKYTGTDTSSSYVPPTYTGFGDDYWGGSYWGGGYWGGPYWGGGFYGGGVATGGYWVTTSTVNLNAILYTKNSKDAVWTADITVTDPNYIDQAATTIAQDIYSDWVKNTLVAN